jgi:uncharacterized protein
MKLTFLGGADEVGASCTLIEIAGKRLLVDAGIRISAKTSRGIEGDQLPDLQQISALGGIDYLLVTHAHTDHTGALPLVVGQYPHVPVIMTRPTEALVRVLQKDAQRIMSSNFEEEGELPLFDEVAMDQLMNAIQIVEFNIPLRLGDGLQVTYHVSGHIAGAGLLVIESSEGTLVMSGDVSKSPQRTVESIKVPRIKADALVLESTYGGRLHANREIEERRIVESLKKVIERGGKVLIPAFALGRAQEVLQIIHAYRDDLNVPVYADGMVKSVCEAYNRFQEILPSAMVKAAGDKDLFFRNNVLPISSLAQRNTIASSTSPCIVVASSGMLTGGASQFYAKHFAPVAENAIFLTGYQDEESPGKFLQRLMKERQDGDEPTITLGKDIVKVRCEIGTYSLSAHADEDELVSIAQALKASEVMLVHGDAGARHSLATKLRQRQIIVHTPKTGSSREMKFKKRPWGVGVKLNSANRQDAPNLAELWKTVKDQAGNYFSLRELCQMWWGSNDREAEMQNILTSTENIFFPSDWRTKTNYRVNSVEQVEVHQRNRAVMLANPDIVGKLIVLRNSNDQAKLALVTNADIDHFIAETENAKGKRYNGSDLVWVIGTWERNADSDSSNRSQLNQLRKKADTLIETLLPYSRKLEIAQSGQVVNPQELLPNELPEGIDKKLALLTIVIGLANEHATVEQNGLRIGRASETGPVEQNQAREIAMATFPKEARLRKVGLDVHRKMILLFFDFPSVAQQKYAKEIERIIDKTGWRVELNPTVNQQTLLSLLLDMIPATATVVKKPSYFMDRQEVSIEVQNLENAEDIQKRYYEQTHFKLIFGKSEKVTAPTGTVLEINAAYQMLKKALEPRGLYKTSLINGAIMLSFITPQVGKRYQEVIDVLQDQTGYPLSINPNPNQQLMLVELRRMLDNEGIELAKNPAIHMDKTTIAITIVGLVLEEERKKIAKFVGEKMGYEVQVEAKN